MREHGNYSHLRMKIKGLTIFKYQTSSPASKRLYILYFILYLLYYIFVYLYPEKIAALIENWYSKTFLGKYAYKMITIKVLSWKETNEFCIGRWMQQKQLLKYVNSVYLLILLHFVNLIGFFFFIRDIKLWKY